MLAQWDRKDPKATSDPWGQLGKTAVTVAMD
jgi:hypothetical protein